MQHVEIPRLGIQLDLNLLGYSTAIAMPDPSCVCSLHLSSQQYQILNSLSGARDQTLILMDTSQVITSESLQELPKLFFERFLTFEEKKFLITIVCYYENFLSLRLKSFL